MSKTMARTVYALDERHRAHDARYLSREASLEEVSGRFCFGGNGDTRYGHRQHRLGE